MAVNITVLSTFNDAGLKRARAEMDKLSKKVESSTSKTVRSAGAIGAGVLAGAGVAVGALYTIGTSFDSAYDNLRVNTGKTGVELENLKGDLRAVASQVPDSFDAVSTALAGFASNLGLSGKPLEDLSIQILNLSRVTGTDLATNIDAVATVMKNFGVITAYQGPAMDVLFRASQQTGVSITDLATQMAAAGPVLRSNGFDFQSSAAFIAQLAKAGLDVGDVMPTLSKSLALAAKNGQDAGSYLGSAFDRIRNAPNEIAAGSAAMDAFGPKGVKMAELIRSGALSFDDLKNSIGQGDSINQAAADTEDFSEKFNKLKNRIMLAIEPFASKVFDKVGEIMDWIGPKVDQVTKYFQEHETVAKVVAAIIGGALVLALIAVNVQLVLMAINVLAATWPIVLIIAVIALLVAGFIYAWNNFDWFRNGIITAWDAIKDAFNAAWNVIRTIFTAIVDVVRNTVVPFFKDTLIPIFISIWNTAKTVWDKISEVIQFAWQYVILPVLRDIKLFIDNIIIPIFNLLWSVIETVWNAITDAISFAWNSIIKPVFDFIVGGVQFVIDKFFEIKDAIGSALSNVADAIKTPFAAAFNFIVDAWNATVGGFGFTAPDWLKYIPGAAWFAGKSITIPKLSRWEVKHTGGIVSGAPGASVPMMLQTGEMVLSQDQQAMLLGRISGSGGGSNVTINVTVAPTADKAAVGQAIVEALSAYERRSGAGWRAA